MRSRDLLWAALMTVGQSQSSPLCHAMLAGRPCRTIFKHGMCVLILKSPLYPRRICLRFRTYSTPAATRTAACAWQSGSKPRPRGRDPGAPRAGEAGHRSIRFLPLRDLLLIS